MTVKLFRTVSSNDLRRFGECNRKDCQSAPTHLEARFGRLAQKLPAGPKENVNASPSLANRAITVTSSKSNKVNEYLMGKRVDVDEKLLDFTGFKDLKSLTEASEQSVQQFSTMIDMISALISPQGPKKLSVINSFSGKHYIDFLASCYYEQNSVEPFFVLSFNESSQDPRVVLEIKNAMREFCDLIARGEWSEHSLPSSKFSDYIEVTQIDKFALKVRSKATTIADSACIFRVLQKIFGPKFKEKIQPGLVPFVESNPLYNWSVVSLSKDKNLKDLFPALMKSDITYAQFSQLGNLGLSKLKGILENILKSKNVSGVFSAFNPDDKAGPKFLANWFSRNYGAEAQNKYEALRKVLS